MTQLGYFKIHQHLVDFNNFVEEISIHSFIYFIKINIFMSAPQILDFQYWIWWMLLIQCSFS